MAQSSNYPRGNAAPAASQRGGLAWSFESWFGSQIGASLWMLVAGLMLLVPAPACAGVVLALFALVNTCGTLLWRRRDRLRVHAAMQAQLWLSSAATIGALFALERMGGFERLPGVGAGPVSAWRWTLGVLAMTAMLSLLFQRNARASRADTSA